MNRTAPVRALIRAWESGSVVPTATWRRTVLERAIEWTRPERLVMLAAVGMPLAIYVATLIPTVNFGDWAEMQTVPRVLGIAHPTGYPTYTLVGHLFSYLPLGSVAYRANLLSAVSISVGLGILAVTMMRLGVRPLIAYGITLALAAVSSVWRSATRADPHALQFLLAALIVHRLVVWEQDRRPRDLLLGALLLGVSLGNHVLTLLMAPVVVAYALWVGRRELIARPLLAPMAGMCFAAGALVYAYIPLRSAFGAPEIFDGPTDWENFWSLVSGAQFRATSLFEAQSAITFVAKLPDWIALVVNQGTVAFAVLAVLGLLMLLDRERAFALFSAALVTVNVFVFANWISADLDRYLFASWIILAIWAAVAAERIVSDAPKRAAPLAALLVVIPAMLLVVNWPQLDESRNDQGERFKEHMFRQLPENAALFTIWDAATPLWYGQLIDGQRTDVTIRTGLGLTEEMVRERPVYVLHLFDDWLVPLREQYLLVPQSEVDLPFGSTRATHRRALERVEALPAT